VAELACQLTLTRQTLLYLQGKGNFLAYLNLFYWSYSAPFRVGQIFGGDPGLSTDLAGACQYQGEEGTQLFVGL
jgi:hypothetical protein